MKSLSVILAMGALAASSPADPAATILRDGAALPFATAAEALASAQPGDTVELASGDHAGPLVIETDRVVLRGRPGARVRGNRAEWVPVWTKAPSVGRLAYTSPIGFVPGLVTADERALIDARKDRGGLVLHDGPYEKDSRKPVGGVFTYLASEGLIAVSFEDGSSPEGRAICAAPERQAIVTVRNARGCRVAGLAIACGSTGVLLENCEDCTVDHCLVYAANDCVVLGRGATRCAVLACDLTQNPDSYSLDYADIRIGKAVWHAHKNLGTYDKHAVFLDCAGEGNEIAGCYLHNIWDGVSMSGDIAREDVRRHYEEHVFRGVVPYNRAARVHHNRIDLAMDDALEPNDQVADHQWYGNVVTRARCALRLKTISTGPFYVYDNVLAASGTGLRIYKSSPPQASVYVFNNLVSDVSGIVALKMDSVCWDDPWLKASIPLGSPSFRLRNNVFLCDTPFFNQGSSVPPKFRAGANVFTAARTGDYPPADAVGEEGSLFGARPVFRDVARGDFRLAPDSPGASDGLSLDACCDSVATPSGASAFAGLDALPRGLLGTEGKTPDGPVSGLWEIFRKDARLGERTDPYTDDSGQVVAPKWGVHAVFADYLRLP